MNGEEEGEETWLETKQLNKTHYLLTISDTHSVSLNEFQSALKKFLSNERLYERIRNNSAARFLSNREKIFSLRTLLTIEKDFGCLMFIQVLH